MNEMGGNLQAFSQLLQFQVLHFKKVQPEGVIFIEQMRVVGNGAGCQPQGLNVRDFHQTVNGRYHIFLVQKRIASGNNNFLDIRRIAHIVDCLLHICCRRIGLVSGIFMLPETETTVHRAAHVQQKDDPVAVHLL